MGAVLLANLAYYIPEILVAVTMLALLFIESTYKQGEGGRLDVYIAATVGLLAAVIALVFQMSEEPQLLFFNAVVIDPFSTLIKIVMVLGALGSIYLSKSSRDVYSGLKSEFAIMATGVLLGGMVLVSSYNLLILYLGIETLSILSYVLASFKKNDSRSSEAGLKYALYGGVSAGIMLFGMSHIYGVMGSIQFAEIVTKLPQLESSSLFVLLPSFLLFFAGLGYKISCVPFHMWTPDVYEGAPIPVTTFFAIVPKVAALGALVRVSMLFFGAEGALKTNWELILQVVAALTITVGNVTAINQRSVKRMLAFSSIAHAGMMLLGVVVISHVGARALLFYGITYLFMTLVAFYVTSYISDQTGNDDHDRFNGLVKRYPIMAIAMSIALFSLTGLPPFSGFIAKFNIIAAVVEKEFYGLAIIAAINSVISLYYYMRVIRLMVFKEEDSVEKIPGFSFSHQSLIVLMTIPVIFLGIFWESVMTIADGAKIFIQ